MKYQIVNYAGWFAIKDELGGHVLDRNLRHRLWKTKAGAIRFAERNGYEIAE